MRILNLNEYYEKNNDLNESIRKKNSTTQITEKV